MLDELIAKLRAGGVHRIALEIEFEGAEDKAEKEPAGFTAQTLHITDGQAPTDTDDDGAELTWAPPSVVRKAAAFIPTPAGFRGRK